MVRALYCRRCAAAFRRDTAGPVVLARHPARRGLLRHDAPAGAEPVRAAAPDPARSPDRTVVAPARRLYPRNHRSILRRPVRGRRDLSDARPEDAGRMGVVAAIAAGGRSLFTQDDAARRRRHYLPVATGAAGLRSVPPVRLSGAGDRRCRLSHRRTVAPRGLAAASLRDPALGAVDRADVVEPGEVRLSRMV